MASDSLRNRLDRFQQHIAPPKNVPQPSVNGRLTVLASALEGNITRRRDGDVLIVRREYPWGHCHGNATLQEPEPGESVPMAAYTALDEPGELDFERMLFIDTETTGLGGSGAVAFLVGCGSVTPTGFEVRQYFLPDYADETALLEMVVDETDPETCLVSYNGAAFDLPLLVSRLILNRVGHDYPHHHHLDLLHGARRIYRRRLKDCTLVNLERELLGFYRDDDIPGYLIPSVYFEWLSEDSTDSLEAVLEHNRLDILSLYFVARELAAVHRTRGDSLTAADDLHSLARVYGRRKQVDEVTRLFERIESSTGDDLPLDMLLYHAFGMKRKGDWPNAERLFLKLAQTDSRESWLACIELAKYYEHGLKDCPRALQMVRQVDSESLSRPQRQALQHRLSRLRRKIESQN